MLKNTLKMWHFGKENIIILFLFFLLCVIMLNGESRKNNTYITMPDNIIIDKDTIKKSDWKNIVISQKDSITFTYHCESNDTSLPFLFNVKLQNEKDINTQSTNSGIIIYYGLPEGKYDLSIFAFSQRWSTNPATIWFRVNNREDSLNKVIKLLIYEVKSLKQKKNFSETAIAVNKSFLIIISIILPIFFVIIFILIKFRKKLQIEPKFDEYYEEISPTLYFEEQLMNTPEKQTVKPSYEDMTEENSQLREEINSLRKQIDILQNRSYEMKKKNKELEEKVDKLSKGKKELEELQKQKDELFAVIIHDIKNPVALIKSLVELLRSYDLSATEQQEIIADIFETTTKIVSLSQEVSRILSLETTSITLSIEPTNINDVINDVCRRNTVSAKNKSINILLDLKQDLPEAELDFQKVEEIIDNLVSNAIKFSHAGGEIRLRSNISEDNSLIIEVSDNGLGLSEGDIQKAFQRGARLSAKPTGNEPSSGLGLWIVRKLVEAHNGRVWVKSALGKGSTFAFSLPVAHIKQENEQVN